MAAGADEIALFVGAHRELQPRQHQPTIDQSLADARRSSRRRRRPGWRVRGYISVAFGCPYEGPVAPATVPRRGRRLLDLGCDEVSLGDTIGVGDARRCPRVLDAVLPLVDVGRVGLHAHDTRGTALANVYAALERGVDRVDSSAGGLGGCPFAGPGAAGNLATEDLVYLLDGLRIEHGVSLEGVMAASAFIQSAVGHPLRSPTWLAGGRPVTRPLPGTDGDRAV